MQENHNFLFKCNYYYIMTHNYYCYICVKQEEKNTKNIFDSLNIRLLRAY